MSIRIKSLAEIEKEVSTMTRASLILSLVSKQVFLTHVNAKKCNLCFSHNFIKRTTLNHKVI